PQNNDVDVTFTYDGLNRPIRADYRLGINETWTYDGNGNVSEHIDKRGLLYTTDYDNLNRPLATTLREDLSNNGATFTLRSFSYDDASHRFTQTDANRNVTGTLFDGLDRPVTVTDAFQKSVTSVYDGVNLRVRTDRKHQRTEFTYDALNRLT